jgi:hypothetical protein
VCTLPISPDGACAMKHSLSDSPPDRVVHSMECWADDAVLWLTKNASPSSGGQQHKPRQNLRYLSAEIN